MLGSLFATIACAVLLYVIVINADVNRPLVPEISGAIFISFKLIKQVTNNFHENMILGKGGFSVVYRGIINGEPKWAVKKAKVNVNNDTTTFRHEVETLAQIRHVNLVELIGYSLTKYNDQIIVLEYMPGGTLYDRLRNSDTLQLNQRLHIALDAAEGLNYLHKFTRNGIVHRDIKSTNILLDAKGVAKVSDFGLSRTLLSAITDNHTLQTVKTLEVTHVAGTYGYMDPEWFINRRLERPIASTFSDVYAFGVVLFEIITGKAALVTVHNEIQTLVSAVKDNISANGIISIIDTNMNINTELYDIVVQLVTLANECCSKVESSRPTMEEVTTRLKHMCNTVKYCNNVNTAQQSQLSRFQELSSTFDQVNLIITSSDNSLGLVLESVLVPR